MAYVLDTDDGRKIKSEKIYRILNGSDVTVSEALGWVGSSA